MCGKVNIYLSSSSRSWFLIIAWGGIGREVVLDNHNNKNNIENNKIIIMIISINIIFIK